MLQFGKGSLLSLFYEIKETWKNFHLGFPSGSLLVGTVSIVNVRNTTPIGLNKIEMLFPRVIESPEDTITFKNSWIWMLNACSLSPLGSPLPCAHFTFMV